MPSSFFNTPISAFFNRSRHAGHFTGRALLVATAIKTSDASKRTTSRFVFVLIRVYFIVVTCSGRESSALPFLHDIIDWWAFWITAYLKILQNMKLHTLYHAANTQENSTLWLYRNFLKGCYISLERWFYKDQENWGCNFQKLVRAEKINPKGADLTPLGFSQFFSKPAKIFQKEIYMVLETSICDHFMVDSLLGVDPTQSYGKNTKNPI